MRRFLVRVVLVGSIAWSVGLQAAVSVVKIPTPGAISAGDAASFQYLVSNGATAAGSVTLTDPLPAGVVWSDNSTACTIDGTTRVLSCSFGTLPAFFVGVLVQVSGITDYADCGTLASTATVMSTAGGSQSSAGVVVLCPDVRAAIVPDTLAPGAPVAFTLSVRNAGPGIARGVQLSFGLEHSSGDPFVFTIEPPDGLCGVSVSKTACNVGDLGPGAGHSHRIVSASTGDSACGSFVEPLEVFVENEPSPECCPTIVLLPPFEKTADANADCLRSVLDVLYLINFLFAGGPPPAGPT